MMAMVARAPSAHRAAPAAAVGRAVARCCSRRHLTSTSKTAAAAAASELLAARGVVDLQTVRVGLEGHVATMTIDRPKALNALSATVVEEMGLALDALAELTADSTLRCLIVTGGGEKAFVAGADIAGMVGMSTEDAAAYSAATHAAFEKIDVFPAPTLAAVNGFALGGGCGAEPPPPPPRAASAIGYGAPGAENACLCTVCPPIPPPRAPDRMRACTELAMACDVIYASDRAKFGQVRVPRV
jgi:hypothetical protein